MIYSNLEEDEDSNEIRQLIGIQKASHRYIFLHWGKAMFKPSAYSGGLDKHNHLGDEYSPIGPTLLVEWGDE